MSHFINVNTKVTNKSLLVSALKRLSLPVSTVTDEKVVMEEQLYFQNENQNWALKGDPYYCKNRELKGYYQKEDALVRKVNVAYAAEEAMLNAQLQGLSLVNEQKEGNNLVLTFEG